MCCWAGLTPRPRESGRKLARGHITKQGSPALRWAMIEAIQRLPAGAPVRQRRDAIIARRGKQARNIAKTAAAWHLLAARSTRWVTGTSGPWAGRRPETRPAADSA